jgi:hypothetical protein
MNSAVSQTDFARICGVSRKTVTVWKAQGHLVFDAKGRVAVTESIARLEARPDVNRGGLTRRVGNGRVLPNLLPATSSNNSDA